MAPQQRFRVGSQPRPCRFEVGDRLPASKNGEMLAPMLDCIQEIREIAGCFGRAYLRHNIRLSDKGRASPGRSLDNMSPK